MTYGAIIRRDLRLGFLRGGDALAAVAFFVIVASLFPLALGGEEKLIAKASAAVIWVAALLSALLSLENIYHRDYDDGTFDLLFMTKLSPVCIMAAKMFSHWLMSGCALVVAAAVVSQMQFVPAAALPVLLGSLALGTVYLSLLGGAGAVLTLGSKRPGVLLTVIILPLYVPVLVLGVLAAEAASGGLAYKGYLLLQAALCMAALPLMPWIAARFLKGQLST